MTLQSRAALFEGKRSFHDYTQPTVKITRCKSFDNNIIFNIKSMTLHFLTSIEILVHIAQQNAWKRTIQSANWSKRSATSTVIHSRWQPTSNCPFLELPSTICSYTDTSNSRTKNRQPTSMSWKRLSWCDKSTTRSTMTCPIIRLTKKRTTITTGKQAPHQPL